MFPHFMHPGFAGLTPAHTALTAAGFPGHATAGITIVRYEKLNKLLKEKKTFLFTLGNFSLSTKLLLSSLKPFFYWSDFHSNL